MSGPIDRIECRLDAIEQSMRRLMQIAPLVEKLLVKQPTRGELAKQAGVSRSTLYRRRRKIELQALAVGRRI